MSSNPGVDFFLSFYARELDSTCKKEQRCIFFTQQRDPWDCWKRCCCDCLPGDKEDATKLREWILEGGETEKLLPLIQEYILCNCCRGVAVHQERIEKHDILEPLAKRWLEQIQRTQTPVPGPLRCSNKVLGETPAFETNATSSPSSTRASTITTTLAKPYSHNLRSNNSERPDLRRLAHYHASRASQFKFQPHIREPGPNDTVSFKFFERLDRHDRDFETGRVYIFSRTSSPGHVKIGWTYRSVEDRLANWADCGYTPKLLFSVDDVPNAHRVETLTHYELMKEWRRERRCKGCSISHQEWFEVAQERAIQVLGDWAEFFKKAQPYFNGAFDDPSVKGKLKAEWANVVTMLEKGGKSVTSATLLEHYRYSIREQAPVVNTTLPKAETSDAPTSGSSMSTSSPPFGTSTIVKPVPYVVKNPQVKTEPTLIKSELLDFQPCAAVNSDPTPNTKLPRKSVQDDDTLPRPASTLPSQGGEPLQLRDTIRLLSITFMEFSSPSET